jgi:hypothetical protein
LPVARFQRLSGGRAVFPKQDHATVQAFHIETDAAYNPL